MGIKGFTQVFANNGEFKYKEFKGKNVVIDASVEIYRAALGMKISEQLTNSFGVPTAHINTILLGVILKLKAAEANQYWIFDRIDNREIDNIFHNPLKQLELKKRKEKRKVANKKIDDLNLELNDKLNILEKGKGKEKSKSKGKEKQKDDDLFTDESEDEMYSNRETHSDNEAQSEGLQKGLQKGLQSQIEKCKEDIGKQEKVAFSMKPFYIEDIIFILDMLEIPWMESPCGYESEQIAAAATNNKNIFGVKMHYVFSPDSDALVFGARMLIKRDVRKKKLFKYDLNNLLVDNNLTQDDLIKVSLILGCDFAPKTPRIGIKTVLKKYKDVELTEEQKHAFILFKKTLNANELENINIKNTDKVVNIHNKPFTNVDKFKQLLEWLKLVKDYNISRIITQFHKHKLFPEVDNTAF